VGPALAQAAPGVSTVNINRLPPPLRNARAGQANKVSMAVRVDRNTLLPRHGVQAEGSGASSME
jgi:hypothetical protein